MKFRAHVSSRSACEIYHASFSELPLLHALLRHDVIVSSQWPDCTSSCLRHYPVRQPTCDAVDWDVAAHFCTVIPLSLIPCDYSPYTVIENNHHETLTDFTSLACEVGAIPQLWAVTHATTSTTYWFLKGSSSPMLARLEGTTVSC